MQRKKEKKIKTLLLLKIHYVTPQIIIKHQEPTHTCRGPRAPVLPSDVLLLDTCMMVGALPDQPASQPCRDDSLSRFSTVSIVSSRVSKLRPRKAYWKPGKGPASKPSTSRGAQYVLKPSQRVNALRCVTWCPAGVITV